MLTAEGIEQPEGNIVDVQESHKYLGIPQADGHNEQAAWMSATAKYLQGVRQVLKSQLNKKIKIQALNIYALPVIRYLSGMISRPLEAM